MLVGNSIDNLDDIKLLVNINPNRYAMPPADFDILPDSNNAKTTEKIERTSRWWLSMADSMSRQMISHREVSPLQNYGEAFKVEKVGQVVYPIQFYLPNALIGFDRI
jgi:hypothetical protein